MTDSLFVPQFHDNVTGAHVGTMTVYRNGAIGWGQSVYGPDSVVAQVHANYNKEGRRVRLDVRCKGSVPEWLSERMKKAMLKMVVAHRRELEKEYHVKMEEKITGKIRRYNRLA